MEPLQWVRLPPEQSSWYTWWIVMKSCALIDTDLILVLRSNSIDSVVSAIGLDSQLDTVWSLNIFGKERILQFIQFCFQSADRLTKSFASYGKNIRSHLTHVPITPICSNLHWPGCSCPTMLCPPILPASRTSLSPEVKFCQSCFLCFCSRDIF